MNALVLKIAIISKYKLENATRYQLPISPNDPVTRELSSKRAFLEVTLPGQETDLVLMTTHLEVPDRGQAIKQAEVAQLSAHLQTLEAENRIWVIGGDFNLLPPGQYEHLPESEGGHSRTSFRQETELLPLLEAYHVVPDLVALQGPHQQDWYTMFLNDPEITEPSHTVDYFFYPDALKVTESYIFRGETLTISDHLPVIATFILPDTKD